MTQVVAFSGDLLNRQTTLNKRRHSLIASTIEEVKDGFSNVTTENNDAKFHSAICFETGELKMSQYPTRTCNNYPRCHEFTVKVFLFKEDPKLVTAAVKSILSEMDFKYADTLIVAFGKDIETRDIGKIWKAAEELKSSGRVQSIGVADLTISQLQHLTDWCSISPDILQICPSTYDEDFKDKNSSVKEIMAFGNSKHLRITTHNDPVHEFDEMKLKASALAEKYETAYIGRYVQRSKDRNIITMKGYFAGLDSKSS